MTSSARLTARLARHVEIQRRLLALADEQADALRIADLDALRTIVAQQETAVLESGRLERERSEEARVLCESLGLGPDATVEELAAALPAADGRELDREARTLRGVAAELRAATGRNRELIEHELALIDQLVRHVIVGETSGYGGRQPLALVHRLCDREA